jgi:pimeloyl-ACP methyl ester carboxylesterase
MKMEFFTKSSSTGITVHINDSQKGDKTIFLLHGYLETMYIWSELAEHFEKDYRIIAIDLPGHGISGSHPECNSVELCADVVKDVLSNLNIDECILGGHSLGGYVALSCIQRYPQLFSKLIIFNSNPYPDAAEKQALRSQEIEIIRNGGLSKIADSTIPHLYKPSNLRACNDKIKETIDLCDTHDPLGICASIKGLQTRPDRREDLKSWKKPSLWLYGDSDLHMTADKIEFMKQTYPDFKHTVVPECGHMSFIEQKDFTYGSVVSFLND